MSAGFGGNVSGNGGVDVGGMNSLGGMYVSGTPPSCLVPGICQPPRDKNCKLGIGSMHPIPGKMVFWLISCCIICMNGIILSAAKDGVAKQPVLRILID